MRIPKKRSLNELPEIKGLKNPASNAKKITKQTYLKLSPNRDKILFNTGFEFNYQINF